MKPISELLADPNYKKAMETLEKGDAIKALTLLESVLREDPGHYVAWNNIGFLLYRANYVKEAENAFLKATALAPEYTDAHSNLFQLYLSDKRTALAREQFEALKRLEPENTELATMEKDLSALGTAPAPAVTAIDARGPLCSIVLATYNRPKLLPVALESALKQTYRNIEVVVVNDGGCDVSGIVAGFNDPRVKYVAKPVNMGAGNSYNTAIFESTGRYIGYLADDDLYYPNHVETLITALEKNPQYGGAYSDQYRVNCEMNEGVYTKILGKQVDYSYDFDKVLLVGRTNFIPHPCLIHCRDLLKKTGVYDETLSVLIDWDLLRRMAFYTDFLHIKTITGEYFFPQNKQERISNVFDKDPDRFRACLRQAFSKRPPKPWDRMKELTYVLYCRKLSSATLEQLKFIVSQLPYPSDFLLMMDTYDKAAMDTVKGLGMDNVKALFNITPAGFAGALKKLLNSYFPDTWLLALDESVTLNDEWLKKTYGDLQNAVQGKYAQPQELRVNALYTAPWDIRL
ncbi:MAG: glycosyltransferase [Fibrobacterota bacterium]